MPKIVRSGQDWILDRFIGTLGVNALMPGFMTFMASPIVGFNNADLEYIGRTTKGVSSMRRAYERVGKYREGLAQEAEARGYVATARRQFHYASLAYGFAQYTVQEDHSPVKKALHDKSQECFGGVMRHAATPIEKVEIPFEDEPSYDAKTFPGILHLPAGPGPWPCVIFIPGTDMHKEQVPNPEDNIFIKRGMAVLALDGPGQGESLLRMLKVRVDTWNYERAVSAAIDYLETRPEIDSSRIATFGVSTGSYWSPRAAIWEARHGNRIKAAGGLAAQWDPSFVTEFEYAQPNFKSNYMYMAGDDSEAEFDRKAPLHDLRQDIAEITCPILIVQGEYDELCTPDQVEAILANAKAPTEMRIYEDEFHPLGGVAVEAYESAVDWLKDRLDQKPVEQSLITRIPRL
ncbi:alpha/beta hydrolase family protein [Lichenifustis flavocetrariae]|uniref:Prolyl oligopeptidase family serine peptidase n=1 Tax=Lichenifustis flavocetrariae TaxID=2949735 RepID=A0AA42CQ91_9HYPH|nr:prolyl oligopeptidase family serine peptidase [Lichenifustis flavocetrariae]MCW6511210.1 prolyl oligopeptidase family serine peptidase [Lichenifustis flavocetrariae]